MYAAVDGDGDGRVSFVEFAAMRVRKKRGISTPRGQQQQVCRFHWICYLLVLAVLVRVRVYYSWQRLDLTIPD